MNSISDLNSITELAHLIKGEISVNQVDRLQFSTDASAYREKPIGVVWPRDVADLEVIIEFANRNRIPLIPRGAGTSLAGQVVGNGLVVNLSKYMNQILAVNEEEKFVWVEPGVVLDELNIKLREKGLFFGPETSTSNRCTIGGMLGNNSCGSHSLVYGSTRDHVLEVVGYLANGDKVHFKPIKNWELEEKCVEESLEGKIYREIQTIFSDQENIEQIKAGFPHPDIHRRNTGYALDVVGEMSPFTPNGAPINLSKLIAGSEGTLILTSKIKLNLVDLPPQYNALVCVHLNSLDEALKANIEVLKLAPRAVELIDDKIISLARQSVSQKENHFFIQGDPGAMLLIDLARDTKKAVNQDIQVVIDHLKNSHLGYSFPVVWGPDIKRVWALRKAGLGVLSNLKGDSHPVAVIEDTAVRPEDLPAYVKDIKEMLGDYGKDCVFYAHVGSGELHLRPILNLKQPQDVILFRKIAKETAALVKKYKGSLSGEHGDGRLRGEFIPGMVGDKNYKLMLRIKQVFDTHELLNPEKIVQTPPMNSSLRYRKENVSKVFDTQMNWSELGGITRATEKCAGSGDCLKSSVIGGTMCPSYMATRDEKHSTRGRVNILREYFTGTLDDDQLLLDEVHGVLSLCLSCKACKSECPSGVDVAALKSEFIQYYNSQRGVPIRSLLIGYSPSILRLFSAVPLLYNTLLKIPLIHYLVRVSLGFHSKRHLPKLSSSTLRWYGKWRSAGKAMIKTVYLLADEFTNYTESDLGIKTILLLEKLGYRVVIPQHVDSGRAFISKGLLKKAKKLANRNIELLGAMVSPNSPLVGVEPSAILTFRDEYPKLVNKNLRKVAMNVAKASFTIEEFIAGEIERNNIKTSSFTVEKKEIRFHAHCFQKALSSTLTTQKILSFPLNYSAQEIPSGCCGMAGSFGYEKKTYALSMKIGELKLFPEVRNTDESKLIAAAGTSCRQHIADGTGKKALHPVEILYDALV